MDKSVGFLGGGRVARILIGGWTYSGRIPVEVGVYDPVPEALADLSTRYAGILGISDPSEAAAKDIVFLAVHPPAVADVLNGIKDSLKEKAVLVSLAPVVSIARLSEMCGGFERIVRMIPNAPSIVGKGHNPVTFSEKLSSDERELLMELFSSWGNCPVVPESSLEAYAVSTAMGPTYFWPQLYELTALAEAFGIPHQAAVRGVGEMINGAFSTMELSGLSAEEVQDLIPVKPLMEDVETVTRAFRENLTALHDKLRGKGS